MPLSDDQYGWGGLTLGAGTSYRVHRVTGLRGQPDVEAHNTPKLEGSGSFSGFYTQPQRDIQMSVTIVGTSAANYESLLAALEAAMALTQTPSAFTWKDPAVATKTVQAVPVKMSAPIVPTRKRFWGQVDLAWESTDVTIT